MTSKEDHIASLPTIEVVKEPTHNWQINQILVEGEDFRFDHCHFKGYSYGQEEYSNIMQPTYGTVAVPIK